MKKNNKTTTNIASIETPINNNVVTTTKEAITESVIEKTTKASAKKEKVSKTALKQPQTAPAEISKVDKAHLTAEQIKEEAEIKQKVDAKLIKAKTKALKYLANADKREAGKVAALAQLSLNKTIPNGDKKAHPDVPGSKMMYMKELEARKLKRKEQVAKLATNKANHAEVSPIVGKKNHRKTVVEKQKRIDEIKLKSGKTVAQRLEMLADRRSNRMNRKITQAIKMTEVGKANLKTFMDAQAKRNEKRGYVAKHRFHTAAEKEAIKAQVVARKAAKAAKPMQFKVEGERTNEFMANCTFVRPDGTKFLQKRYWYASIKEGCDYKALLKAKVEKIFNDLEKKTEKRSIIFESIHVYPNFGKDMGECVTNMIASKKHINVQLDAAKTEMSAAA